MLLSWAPVDGEGSITLRQCVTSDEQAAAAKCTNHILDINATIMLLEQKDGLDVTFLFYQGDDLVVSYIFVQNTSSYTKIRAYPISY